MKNNEAMVSITSQFQKLVLAVTFSTLLLNIISRSPAKAATLTLNATVNSSRVSTLAFTDFQIVFEDTGDGLFQSMELFSFSGVTIGRRDRNEEVFYDVLRGIPTLPGFSVGNASNWQFSSTTVSSGVGVVNEAWTYKITTVKSVPEPATTLNLTTLLGCGALIKRGNSRNR
ncbi:MAG: hypothetical protein F6K23_36315 [Okeania sp. SIO2C9]|uniref:hypothetical protein n=1 Tax=Okeania sp. SIO2C9 TaxID=2607791 RepID=UPI0013BEB7F2|nr:hypothetical protein [Okeania sp. SIO2C9]NEQ77993.1 hypothetical protein [Okeania sp. SIO2C9]